MSPCQLSPIAFFLTPPAFGHAKGHIWLFRRQKRPQNSLEWSKNWPKTVGKVIELKRYTLIYDVMVKIKYEFRDKDGKKLIHDHLEILN